MSDTTKIEEISHSHLGASGAYRWMVCSGSPNLIRKLGDDALDAGLAADEGTAAHELAALCLGDKGYAADTWEYIGHEFVVGKSGHVFTVDQDMADAVQVHLNFVRSILDDYKARGVRAYLNVERSLKSRRDSRAYGTADVVISAPSAQELTVVDYKHGRFVCCEPDGPQTRYYGALASEDRNLKPETHVRLYIVQPRMPHPKGTIRGTTTTSGDLEEWFQSEVIPAMEATDDPHAPLVVGEHCRFCPARSHCPAIEQTVADLDLSVDPVYMTDDELGDTIAKKSVILKWFENAEYEAFQRASRGAKIKGHKLVKKKANRTWKPGAEDHIREAFGDDAYNPPTLKTPPNIEKLPGGAKYVSRWAHTPDTGLTLAAESDKRVAVRPLMVMDAEDQSVHNDEEELDL